MVLLKRTFCWDLDDVVYNSLKVSPKTTAATTRVAATDASKSSSAPPERVETDGSMVAQSAAENKLESRGAALLDSLPAVTVRQLEQLIELDKALYDHFNR
jgi:hypothetical protein